MRYLLVFLFYALSVLVSFSSRSIDSPFSYWVVFTSLLIQLISVYNLFTRNHEFFSFYKFFYLFSLFFFGIAPLIQYFNKTIIWFKRPLFEEEYIYTNIIIIGIITLYGLLYNLFRFVKYRNISSALLIPSNLVLNVDVFKSIILVLISIFAFFIVFQSNNFSLLAMLIRGGDLIEELLANTVTDESPTKWLIINNFIRPISMISFLVYAINLNRNKFVYFLLLILAITTCFPTAMPRFAAAALYIPFTLIIFPFLKKKYLFILTFIFGLLVIFPSLDLFRTFSSDGRITFKPDFEMFKQGHFDCYQNFSLILNFDIVTYGKQLFGVLFFWIPRTFWTSKPIGSGSFLAEQLDFSFSNVSANYFAEGYINFGFIGIILFTILISFFTAKADNLFWKNFKHNFRSNFDLIYLISLGFIFFILRGDLLSSIAYFIGYLSALKLILILVNFNSKNE